MGPTDTRIYLHVALWMGADPRRLSRHVVQLEPLLEARMKHEVRPAARWTLSPLRVRRLSITSTLLATIWLSLRGIRLVALVMLRILLSTSIPLLLVLLWRWSTVLTLATTVLVVRRVLLAWWCAIDIAPMARIVWLSILRLIVPVILLM